LGIERRVFERRVISDAFCFADAFCSLPLCLLGARCSGSSGWMFTHHLCSLVFLFLALHSHARYTLSSSSGLSSICTSATHLSFEQGKVRGLGLFLGFLHHSPFPLCELVVCNHWWSPYLAGVCSGWFCPLVCTITIGCSILFPPFLVYWSTPSPGFPLPGVLLVSSGQGW
jgi:hypothetical protein